MPPLRFAPYREIAQEIAARLIASRIGLDPLAPWPEEVLVPSRGVAEALVHELLSAIPGGIAALRIQTIEELAQRTLAMQGQTPRVANDVERRLAMRTAIRGIDHPMMESRGVAAMLERAYRDVRDSGVPLHELAKRIDRTRGLRNAQRTAAILEAWREYERLIAQLQAIDAADRLAHAARLAEKMAPQLVAGFYDMTGAQLALLQSLLRADRVAAIWVPTEEPFAQGFVKAIAPYAEVVRNPVLEIQRPRVIAMQHDTPLEEMRGVCARVAELLREGVPAREIGIVARSLEPYDARLLNRFAQEHGFATSRGEEIPLTAHRIGRGAVTLLKLRDRGFPRGEVLELVRDGLYVKTRLDVDAVDAATRKARIAGGTSQELRAIRTKRREVEDYVALVTELEELTQSLDLDFATRLSSLFRIETAEDLAAAAELDDVATVFRRATSWNKGFDPLAFIDAIEQQSIPHQSSPHQPPTTNHQLVWAGEILRFRGRTFTHLFAIRMQDDVFPQRRTEDPLLPDSDRRLLHLREIGDGRDEEALLFSLLTDSTSTTLTFTCATGDGFGKVLRPSRYLRTIPRATQSPTNHQPSTTNARERAHQRQRQLQLLTQSGKNGPFDGHTGPLPSLPESFSPTQLEEFGECPHKFLLKHILGVTDIDHPERELQINPRDKGTIDHRILERFYSDLSPEDIARGANGLPDDLALKLDLIVDAQFDELERDTPPFNHTVRGIERRATRRLLREFVAADLADLHANDLVPRWFEYRFGTKHRELADHPEPFVVTAGDVDVRVEGTIDRIDSNGGRYRIVDYKSGKALRHADLGKKIDRGVRLQLALYAMAVSQFFEADAENVSGTIKPLVAGEKPEKFAFALHEKREALLETLTIFSSAISRGEFPAFPNENDAEFNSCKYCPVNHSCRTKHDLDERYAVQQHKDPRTLLGGEREA